jgi:FKBP-type peptidyl-prolyl cis-trans isomerase (trigger factor)
MSHSHHQHDIDFKKTFLVTKEPGSQVKIAGEIPFLELEAERAGAIKALGQGFELDGFRKGHVPEAIIVKKVGEVAILAEMAERAIAHMYPHILHAHEIAAIGYPKLEITKIAAGSPLGFTAIVAVIPEVTLPDYKKVAGEVNATRAVDEITDTEIEEKINDILRQKAAYQRLQNKASGTDTEITPEGEPVKLDIPELTDEVAQGLGQPGQFTSVLDLKTKLREHFETERKRDNATMHRGKITDAIVDASTIELPQVLIDSELEQMFGQMGEDLKRANLKMDDYLEHIKKTRDDLKAEWTPSAQKRAKLQLILNEIAKQEKIVADHEAIDNETDALLKMYKDADENRVRVYVASVLTNEAVMKMLEASK